MRRSSMFRNEENTEVITEREDKAPIRKESNGSGKPKTGKIVGAEYVRIRQGHSIKSIAAGFAKEGQICQILENGGDGVYKIRIPELKITGYVNAEYLKED